MKSTEYRIRPQIGAVIINERNEVLVLSRNPHRYIGWGMVKGGIEEDESRIDALYRELSEEINLTKDMVEQTLELDFTTAHYHAKKGYISVVEWYLVKAPSTICVSMKCLAEEWQGAQFLSLEKAFNRLTWQTERHALKAALELL